MEIKQKLNLVFDYSNIMFRSLYMIPTSQMKLDANHKYFSNERDLSGFVVKLTKDITSIINHYGSNARIIFAIDDEKPWRKQLIKEIPFKPNKGYKGNRTKSEDYDWKKIFETSNQFINLLKKFGFYVFKVQNAEADDIMAMLKSTLYKQTQDNSIIYITSDEDIRQLIDYNPDTTQFVSCLNPIAKKNDYSFSKTLYINEQANEEVQKIIYSNGFKEQECQNIQKNEKKIDVLDTQYTQSLFHPTVTNILSSSSTNLLVRLVQMDRVNIEVIDPDDIALRKFFCGDDGDNIPALYNYYKNDKIKRITPSIYKKIKESLNLNKITDINESEHPLIGSEIDNSILECMKITSFDYKPSMFFNKQRQLVELNPYIFPKDIIIGYGKILNESKMIAKERSPRVGLLDNDFSYKGELTSDILLEGTNWLKYIEDTPDNFALRDINKYLKKNSQEEMTKPNIVSSDISFLFDFD